MNIEINNRVHPVDTPGDEPLLSLLRDELGLTGTKPGCGEGVCGLCTVLLDDQPAPACRVSVAEAAGRRVRTIEGLANVEAAGDERLHPVQQAWLDVQAFQCGWCTPAQVLTAAALLAANPEPTDDEIVSSLNAVVCRCGTYPRVVAAVRRAAELMRLEAPR